MPSTRSRSPEALEHLSRDLAATATHLVRWIPTQGMNVSVSAARVMARLMDIGPSRISSLATLERCSQPTMTNHVKRLEADNLVCRSADPGDLRASIIDLTDKGREGLSAMRHLLGVNLAPYLLQLTEADLRQLEAGVKAMNRLMALDRSSER